VSDKVIIVTGAATGMGAATARKLKAAGAQVFGLDVKPVSEDAGTFIRCDLSDQASIREAVQGLPRALDAVVNVAGIPGPTPADLVMRVNFLGLRALTEGLFARIRPGGGVVNVASVVGREWPRRREVVGALIDTPDFDAGLEWCRLNADRWARDPYTFSKQCVTAYSLRLAGRALAAGLRCNVVSPGAVETQLTPNFRGQIGEAQYDWMVAQTGRHGRAEEIAEVISFVAAGPCSWLNGADIVVDGGFDAGVASGWIDAAHSPAALARAAKAAR
jgi:NAD(P)-dependent dehydrogenase (short-subunit alcohol dehydrogenase family)